MTEVYCTPMTRNWSYFNFIFHIYILQYLCFNQSQTIFTNSYSWKIVFKSLEAEYESSNVLFNSPVKKHQKLIWHQRFVTQIQNSWNYSLLWKVSFRALAIWSKSTFTKLLPFDGENLWQTFLNNFVIFRGKWICMLPRCHCSLLILCILIHYYEKYLLDP